MAKRIEIRDVSERLYSSLKARAAQAGLSLPDFLRRELEQIAERPTMKEWLARTQQAKPIATKRSAVEVLRELREPR